MAKLPVGLFWDEIEPPPDIVRPDPFVWERWSLNEWVYPEHVAECEAYLAWCRTEQARRFDAILEDMDSELASDQSERAKRWRDFALSSAPYTKLLAIPGPRPPRKRAGRRNVDLMIFEAVGRELEKANNHISVAEAFRLANKDGTWTERQFKGAMTRWYKLNPMHRQPPGRPKKK
jgi:hypothetical protein